MREGDYFNAIQYGKLAISYNPEDARYYFLLADCQVRNPEARWQRLADGYFTKARKFMREGDFFNAIQYGKLAISYNADDARYYFLLADCQVRNPEARWQRLAEQNYIKATQLDSWNAEYLVSLGRFYKRRGLKLRARKQFEQALQIVPAHAVAMQELETL